MKTHRFCYTAALTLLVFTFSSASRATEDTASPPARGYSAAQLYNQGNAYARDHKIGLAVLNYERARLLAPDDPDLQANLRYLRSTSGLPQAEESWYGRVTEFAGANAFFWLGCAGLCVVGASVLAHRQYPRHRTTLLTGTAVGLSLMTITLCDATAMWPAMNEAVVTTPGAPARVAPAGTAESLMTLPEAQTVTIEAQRANFLLVRTRVGKTGWVASADLARVVPKREK